MVARNSFIFLLSGFLLQLSLLAVPVAAQSLFVFEALDQTVPFHPANGIAEFSLDLSVVEDPQSPTFPTTTDSGFVMAFSTDPAIVEVTEVSATGPLELVCGNPWEFFIVNYDPPGCLGGVTIQVLYGTLCDVWTTFEESTPMISIALEAVSSALVGASQPLVTSLIWTDACGFDNQLFSGGGPILPSYDDATLTFTPVDPVEFRRGDSNVDGSIDISDAMTILSYLFLSATSPPCLLAGDVNGDGGSINIADGTYLLAYLFASGPPPAPPFPECSTVPDSIPSDCISFGVCP